MPARNGDHGYGWVTRTLHWATVGVVAVQVIVGWVMDADVGSGRGRGRGGESGGRGRGRGGDDASGYLDDPDTLLVVHVVLGGTLLLLAVARLAWRRSGGLPPWSEALTDRQRAVAHATERALLGLLLVVPATGIVLVLGGDDDLVWLHVGAQVALGLALLAHLATNLRPVVLRRMLRSAG